MGKKRKRPSDKEEQDVPSAIPGVDPKASEKVRLAAEAVERQMSKEEEDRKRLESYLSKIGKSQQQAVLRVYDQAVITEEEEHERYV